MENANGMLTLPPDPNKENGGCALHASHGSAQPYRLVGHHVFPEFLQKRLYGKTTIKKLIWICDNGHYTIHGLFDLLLAGEEITAADKYRNHKELKWAMEGINLYKSALAAIASKNRSKEDGS